MYTILILVVLLFILMILTMPSQYSEPYDSAPWVNGGFCRASGGECYYYPDIGYQPKTPAEWASNASNSNMRTDSPFLNCNSLSKCYWPNKDMLWLATQQCNSRPGHFSDQEYEEVCKQKDIYTELPPNESKPYERAPLSLLCQMAKQAVTSLDCSVPGSPMDNLVCAYAPTCT